MISLQDFIDAGALLQGHFRLSSGLHSDRYLQCARFLMWPPRAREAGRLLAERLAEFSPAAVISPAMGGVVIGHETASALGVPFLFAERVDGAFALRRGFRLEQEQPIGVVEDVFTTGKSTREVIELCVASSARVVAAASIVDRGMPAGALSVPTRSLLNLTVPAWPQSECPLCRDGLPLDTPGSRYEAGKR